MHAKTKLFIKMHFLVEESLFLKWMCRKLFVKCGGDLSQCMVLFFGWS